MELLQTILIMLVTLAILVAVHEFGHFWVARRCDVKVLRFSIGFGRPLLRWRDRDDTEYTLAALPLGGFVKMLDEREGDVAGEELHRAFNRKPVLQRIAIVAAGPIANFLLAIVAYWGLFIAGETGFSPVIDSVEPGSIAEVAGLEPGQEIVAVDGRETPIRQALGFSLLERIGDSGRMTFTTRYPGSDMLYESEVMLDSWLAGVEEPDLYGGLGIKLYLPPILPVVDEVVPGGAADTAGFKVGDQVLSADGEPMPLWEDWVSYIRARPGKTIDVRLRRGQAEVDAVITPESYTDDAGQTSGRIGVAVFVPPMPEAMRRTFDRGPAEALVAGVQRTGELVSFTLESVSKMLQGLISHKNLSGPITIAKVATTSAKSGLESYIGFLALLSVSLGVLNLLPIPVLDGGHLLYYAVELVVGKPVPERIQAVGYQVGLLLVVSLMALALYNDFARL